MCYFSKCLTLKNRYGIITIIIIIIIIYYIIIIISISVTIVNYSISNNKFYSVMPTDMVN